MSYCLEIGGFRITVTTPKEAVDLIEEWSRRGGKVSLYRKGTVKPAVVAGGRQEPSALRFLTVVQSRPGVTSAEIASEFNIFGPRWVKQSIDTVRRELSERGLDLAEAVLNAENRWFPLPGIEAMVADLTIGEK